MGEMGQPIFLIRNCSQLCAQRNRLPVSALRGKQVTIQRGLLKVLLPRTEGLLRTRRVRRIRNRGRRIGALFTIVPRAHLQMVRMAQVQTMFGSRAVR